MEKFKELDNLPNIKVGQVVVLTDTNAEEVRDYIKSSDDLKKIGNKVVEVSTGVVTVIRTQGRISRMKNELIHKVDRMHPFERLHVNYRFAYVRDVLKEYMANKGEQINFDHSVHNTVDVEVVEIWKDPFTSWGSVSVDMQELIESFIKQTAVHFECSEQDVKNQIEIVCTEDEETDNEVDSQS